MKNLGINENTLHTWIGKYTRSLEINKFVRTDDNLYEELKGLKEKDGHVACEVSPG